MYEVALSIIALGAAIVIPMLQYFVTIGNLQANIRHMESDIKSVKDVCIRVSSLETKIEPFWKIIDEQLPMILKGKQGRTDRLLTKYDKNPGLSDEEKWELVDLLTDKYNTSKEIGSKLAIALMIEKLKMEVKE